MSEPEDPRPNEAPEHPIEFAKRVYKEAQDKIIDYDGLVTEGDKGLRLVNGICNQYILR